jgi:hypothetical protein
MGKPKSPTLVAGTPTQPEPVDPSMRELQLRTVSLDPARLSRAPQPFLWRKPKVRTRPLRLH